MTARIYVEKTKKGALFLSSPPGFMLAGLDFRDEMLRHNYECRNAEEAVIIYNAGLIPCTLGEKCVRCTYRGAAQLVVKEVPTVPVNEHVPVKVSERRGSKSKTWELAALRLRKLQKQQPPTNP